MIENLRMVVLAVWAAIHPLAPKAKDAPLIAEGIALAVANDGEEPMTGTREGDAALEAEYAYRESSLRACAVKVEADGNRSVGAFQLQREPMRRACDPVAAAPIWLGRAHASFAHCAGLPPEDRLAELTSGSCDRGRLVARARWRQAGELVPGVVASVWIWRQAWLAFGDMRGAQ